LVLAALVIAVLSAAVGASASAAAIWKFEGAELKTTETIKGVAEESRFMLPGLKVTCEFIDFKMTIKNVGGAGLGEITEFPMEACTSSVPACTVESAEVRVLPWPAHLVTAAGEDYVVIEKMEINLVLEGALCALAGTVKIKGTAGGVFSNVSHTITFNKNTFAATGTSLKVGSSSIEWKAVFTTKALGAHKGEDLEA
jgi:hypothetical protein